MWEQTQRKAPKVDVDAHAGGQGEAPGDGSLAIELNTKSLKFSARKQFVALSALDHFCVVIVLGIATLRTDCQTAHRTVSGARAESDNQKCDTVNRGDRGSPKTQGATRRIRQHTIHSPLWLGATLVA